MSIENSSSDDTFLNPKKSIHRAKKRLRSQIWRLKTSGKTYKWSSKMDKVFLIREGLSYESIEVVSKRMDLPVKKLLNLLDLPQTTYNKKKREKELLSGRDSELVLAIIEILDFGLEVFNGETEKFQRWLLKPNISLGNLSPISLFDSMTGIQEVRNSLNRLEYGNLA